MNEVKVGQVWIDNDKRMSNREIRIVRIDGTHAVGQVVLKPGIHQKSETRIRLDRFRPISTGFRLKTDSAKGQ